jgi:hypothetical protein
MNLTINNIEISKTEFKNEFNSEDLVKKEIKFNENEQERCSLCVSKFANENNITKDPNKTFVITNCGHLFHEDCWKM